MGSLGLLWVGFGGALGVSGGVFWIIFLAQSGLRSENCEMLENYDPLNGIAMFLRPQGLQNEVQIDPKTKKREERREKGRENRGESDFGGKSRRSSKLYAFRGGPRAESIGSGEGNTGGSGPTNT